MTPDDKMDYIYNFTSSPTPMKHVGFDPMSPPYVPGSQYKRNLNRKTLRMDAVYALGLNYDVHNLYSLYEIDATAKALQKLRNQK